jgi:hypothetical protein
MYVDRRTLNDLALMYCPMIALNVSASLMTGRLTPFSSTPVDSTVSVNSCVKDERGVELFKQMNAAKRKRHGRYSDKEARLRVVDNTVPFETDRTAVPPKVRIYTDKFC